MDVYLNQKKIGLTQRDFKGQGGEGAVYVRQGVAYKVYANPAKALPLGKLRELGTLTDPAIIKPEEALLDAAGAMVGYTMRAVGEAEPLCLTFNKAYRDRHNLTPDRQLELVRRLQKLVQHIHEKGILIVDLNEMNFLVADDQSVVYAIDVDSYQTATYPATALMDTVRDRHNQAFSEGTDWFSFAVISFQMFVGIHPYRGKHATLKTLDQRMLANISALNPDVAIPAVCQPIAAIPTVYRDWYEAVLERGQRIPPPDGPVASFTLAPTVQATPTVHNGSLEMRLVGTFDGTILTAVGDFVLTTTAVFHGTRRLVDVPRGVAAQLVVTPSGTPLLAWREQGMLRLCDARRGTDVPAGTRADALMTTEGRLYLRQGGQLLEVDIVETPNRVFAQPRTIGSVLEQATSLFPGVAFQDLLGAKYASLLPESGVCHQVRMPDLDRYRVLDAVFQGGVLLVVAERSGRFDRFVFRFTRDYRSFDCRREDDVETLDANLVTLGSGVALHLTEGAGDPMLTLFSTKSGDVARKEVHDSALTGDCRLLKNGVQARVARGDTLYDIRMV